MYRKIVLAVSLLFLTPLVNAATLQDNGYQSSSTSIGQYLFNVTEQSNVSLWEKSNDDYRLSLFDGDGYMIYQSDDNQSHPGQNSLDAALNNLLLGIGNYTATITYWTNWGNIGDTIAQAFDSGNGSTASQYRGPYQLYVQGDYVAEGHVQQSTVPEPGVVLLMGIGLLSFGFAKKNRQSFGDFSS